MLTRLPPVLGQRVQAVRSRLHAVGTRDRIAIWLAGAALVAGVEIGVVGPMRDRAATVANADRSQRLDIEAQRMEREAQVHADREALQQRLSKARQRIEAHGVVHRDAVSVGDATAVLFGMPGVRVLRVQTQVSAHAPADVAPVADSGVDGASAHAAATTIYAHRVVVTVAGSPSEVVRAVRSLQSASLPWRLLRVEWQRHGPGEVAATCTLGVESTSATWLRV